MKHFLVLLSFLCCFTIAFSPAKSQIQAQTTSNSKLLIDFIKQIENIDKNKKVIRQNQTNWFPELFFKENRHPLNIEEIKESYPQLVKENNSSDVYLVDSVYTSDWDAGMQEWEKSRKITYKYNEQGTAIDLTYSYWFSEAWHDNNRYIFTYNEAGNCTDGLFIFWDENNEVWKNILLVTYSYDNNNLLVKRNVYTWNSSIDDWASNNQVQYNYNESGNPLEEIWYNWNSEINAYYLSSGVFYSYNAENQLISKERSRWNASQEVWKDSLRYQYSYDENGNQVEETLQKWNAVTNNWEWKSDRKSVV